MTQSEHGQLKSYYDERFIRLSPLAQTALIELENEFQSKTSEDP